jgi:hypothetical protein
MRGKDSVKKGRFSRARAMLNAGGVKVRAFHFLPAAKTVILRVIAGKYALPKMR